MTVLDRIRTTDTATNLRAGVLVLAAVAIAGTAVELATERHWNGVVQLVPWFALAALAASWVLTAWRPRPASLSAARVLAALVLLASLYGIWEHLESNLNAGWLDAVYSAGWESLSAGTRWWYAITKTVGAAPPLAPGILAQAALLVMLSTWRHPAMTDLDRCPQTGDGVRPPG
ncbi:hypothetical protein [Catellatospora chokoriensis]|uniref:Uncharacterized protein n=1 Tax=Catellatospora chokoriensis TaxID=310353 RepID=A0A8J3K7G4_9ACTN|nr:hypothetical protein [Catellatospora chokoriensis]GIF93998.1 hypothetical protein Cch02nite_74420 [Catellatospora chokoriensis]